MGLVSRLVDAEHLEREMDDIVKTIVEADAATLRLAKRCIDAGVERDPRGALELEMAAIDQQLSGGQWMGKR
jgi:enoyl-CoA hydratase